MRSGIRKAAQATVLALCLLGFAGKPALLAAEPDAANAAQNIGPEIKHGLTFDIINFCLLVALLVYLYRKHGRAFYSERSESIRKSLEEGRKVLEVSQAQLAAAEGQLARLEEEVSALKKRTEVEIIEERERMHQASIGETERILEHAKVQIQAAANAAKLELKGYAVEQALQQAKSLLRERLNEKSQHHLVDSFLADLSFKISRN